jgi:hypothetical protein
MSDSGDIVKVLGELDRTIEQLGPDRAAQARAAAATLVPPYGAPEAAGWYDRFLEAVGGEQQPLATALANLAEGPASRTVLPHRVMAIGTVARALPERFGPEGDQVQVTLEALSGPGILRSAPGVREQGDPAQKGPRVDEAGDPGPGDPPPIRDEAPAFLALLVDRDALPDVGSYRAFLALAVAGQLVHGDLAGVPPPCTAAVIDVSAEGPVDVAVALVTQMCLTGVTLADLAASTSFMNPANWSDYSYWCEMLPDPANPADPAAAARYLEVVALDCPTSWFEVAVWLDVSPLVRRPKSLIRTYTRSADQAAVVNGAKANGAVDIDEGSIKVADEGGHLRVTTTKRVHFTAPIDSHTLAVIACGAGYGALAAQFVVEGTDGRADDVACPLLATTAGAGEQAETTDDPFRRGIAALSQSLDEFATAAKVSFDKAATGSYTADDLVGDVTGSIVRSVRTWGRLVELAVATLRRPPQVGGVRSDPVRLRPPLTGPCEIKLETPMQSAHGNVLPVGRVGFEPPPLLPAGADAFRLQVDASRLRGTTYFGVAAVTDTATGGMRRVDVDVQVP